MKRINENYNSNEKELFWNCTDGDKKILKCEWVCVVRAGKGSIGGGGVSLLFLARRKYSILSVTLIAHSHLRVHFSKIKKNYEQTN